MNQNSMQKNQMKNGVQILLIFLWKIEKKRYNCSSIDLFDRSVVAILNSSHINAELAVQTRKVALKRNYHPKNLMLHSDQGSQYTSRAFIDYCKAEFSSKHCFSSDEELNNATMD